MKFKTITKQIAGTYTRDGKSIPVTRTETAEVPRLPRNWQVAALGSAVAIVCVLTGLSIVWSTWSIGQILEGGVGYLVAVVFDIAWGVTLLLEYLSRYDDRKRGFPAKLGWILLAVTVGAIAWNGLKHESIAMAVIGAFVSVFAKTLWLGVMKHVNADLSEDDRQWVAAEISAAQAQAAIASVRRQAARTTQKATLELLAMEAEQRDMRAAFGLDTMEEVVQEAAPVALQGPSFDQISKADAIRIASSQHPEMAHTDLSEVLAGHGVEVGPDYVRQILTGRKKHEVEIDAEVIELRK